MSENKILNRPEYDVELHGVSQSMLGNYRKCQKKCRFKLNGIRPISDTPSTAILFGNIFHDALEIVLTAVGAGRIKSADEITRDFVTKVVDFIYRKYEDEALKYNAKGKEDFENTFTLCEPVIYHYFKFWESDFFGEDKKDWTGLEKEFAQTEFGVKYRGRRDGEYIDSQGGLWLMENKTKGQINLEKLGPVIQLDLQCNLYLETLYNEYGIEPKGVLYNLIRKPGLRQGKAEDYRVFMERVEADIEKRPEYYFMRVPVRIPFKKVLERNEKVKRELKEFAEWTKQDESLDYENTSSCLEFNTYSCEYVPLCTNGVSEGLFEKVPTMFFELDTPDLTDEQAGKVRDVQSK